MPVHPWVLAASTSGKSSGGGSGFFILLLFGAALIFLFTRSQRANRRRASAAQSAIDVGSRVVTSSGIYATVVSVDDASYELEVAPGVVIRFAKAAVSRLAPEDPVTTADDETDEDGALKHEGNGADGAVGATGIADGIAAPVTLAKPDPADPARTSYEA